MTRFTATSSISTPQSTKAETPATAGVVKGGSLGLTMAANFTHHKPEDTTVPELTTTTVAVEPKTETKETKVKNTKAKATKKPNKKATKAAAKKMPKERARKEGLRKPQVRILQALIKTKAPNGELSRSKIAEQAKVDVGPLSRYIGELDESLRKKEDARSGFQSLLTLKFVSMHEAEGEPTHYRITAAGKKACDAANAG